MRVRQDPRSKNMNQNVYWRLVYLEPKTSALGMLRETLQKRGDMPAGVWGKSQEVSMVPSDLKCLGLLQKVHSPPHNRVPERVPSLPSSLPGKLQIYRL